MIRNHLKELEVAGMLLISIGIVIAITAGNAYGAWPCAAGLAVLLVPFLYKAFHWKEYERENKQYIVIMLICIFMLLIQLMCTR